MEWSGGQVEGAAVARGVVSRPAAQEYRQLPVSTGSKEAKAMNVSTKQRVSAVALAIVVAGSSLLAAAGVLASRAKLAEVTSGPREADRRAAEAAVEQAAAHLQDAISKQEELAAQPKAADVEAAKSAQEKAQRDAEAAQARLAQVER